jgi:hypothetical protein
VAVTQSKHPRGKKKIKDKSSLLNWKCSLQATYNILKATHSRVGTVERNSVHPLKKFTWNTHSLKRQRGEKLIGDSKLCILLFPSATPNSGKIPKRAYYKNQ